MTSQTSKENVARKQKPPHAPSQLGITPSKRNCLLIFFLQILSTCFWKYINEILQFLLLHICLPLLNTMSVRLICVAACSRNSFSSFLDSILTLKHNQFVSIMDYKKQCCYKQCFSCLFVHIYMQNFWGFLPKVRLA